MSKLPVHPPDSGRPTTPAAPPHDAIRAQLDRLLASPSLAHAGRAGPLLRFLVERTLDGRGSELKEYVVATEGLGRAVSFDPRHDAAVRVEAHRLRTKLQLYYATEGQGDPLIIELMKGGYAPQFRWAAAPDSADRPATRPTAGGRSRWVRLVAGVALVAGLISGTFFVVRSLRGTTPSGVPRVAVLPFLDLSDDPANRYFADGVVEELTTELAQVEGLQVIARTSAFQFRSKGEDLAAVGRKLGVTLVIEGSVRRAGDRVRITAQLIRLPGANHVWAQTYDRDARDIFAVQDEIARAVTAALRVGLTTSSTAALVRRNSPDPAAHDLYLQGLHLRSQRVAGARTKAREFFERAIEKDPTFAQPYAALGDAYSLLAFHQIEPTGELIPKALAYTTRALELDDRLAEAHGVLAFIRFFNDWNWPEAEREFRRALQLNPSLARVRQSYALGLMSRRRFDEALRESTMARDLDPLAYAVSNDYAVILHAARRYDESTREAKRTLALDPKFGAAQSLIGLNHSLQRQWTAAIAESQRALALLPGRPSAIVGQLGYCYAKTGRATEARKLIAELEDASRSGVTAYLHMADIYVGLGEPERALDCLERAVAAREGDVPFLDVQLLFDDLRGQPRFEALRKKVGLTP